MNYFILRISKRLCSLCLLTLSLFVTFKSSAQPGSDRQLLDNIFQNVDKTQIPTGYLDEYGAQLAPHKVYNGRLTASNNVTGLTMFNMVYFDIQSSRINNAAAVLPDIDDVNIQINNDVADFSSFPQWGGIPVPIFLANMLR